MMSEGSVEISVCAHLTPHEFGLTHLAAGGGMTVTRRERCSPMLPTCISRVASTPSSPGTCLLRARRFFCPARPVSPLCTGLPVCQSVWIMWRAGPSSRPGVKEIFLCVPRPIPAGTEGYQQMLAKALAHHFEAKLLLLDADVLCKV